MRVIKFRGPRATIQAEKGRIFLGFDADGLHLRIASTASQDPFMLAALTKYDETGDPHWKPHIQNMSALFHLDPEECVALMNVESPKYTFSKNFIYLILNGGDVPALKNAAVSAGLLMDEKEVKFLLDSWLERANMFHKWRLGLVKEAEQTGMVTLPDGRRRRFYGIRWDSKTKSVKINAETLKEIYNTPLICTEVSFMNPRIRKVWDMTLNTDWFIFYHGHDGFMLEGPEYEADSFGAKLLSSIPKDHQYARGIVLTVPFDYKKGSNWAYMGKKWPYYKENGTTYFFSTDGPRGVGYYELEGEK